MATVYLTNVTGDGSSPATAYRPDGFDGRVFSILMLHEAKAKALIVCADDTVTGPGVTILVTAASMAGLRTAASNNSPSAAKRSTMNTWLANNGYAPLTAAQVTWADCLHFIARQVNPAADLSATGV